MSAYGSMQRRESSQISWWGTAVILVITCCGCTSINPILSVRLDVHSSPREPVIVVTNVYKWGYCTHPLMCDFGKGWLGVTYAVAGDPASSEISSADWPYFSTDAGRVWQFGEWRRWNEPPDKSGRIPDKQFKAGVRFYYNGGYFASPLLRKDGTCIVYVRTAERCSVDGGRVVFQRRYIEGEPGKAEWHYGVAKYYLPRSLVGAGAPGNICLERRSTKLPDGVILQAGYAGYDPVSGTHQRYAVYIFSSGNDGYTFRCLSRVATPYDAPWGKEGPCEPALLMTRKGTLLCMMRTGGRRWDSSLMLLARSEDKGKTWSLHRMLIPGVFPDLLQLSNGVIVCSFGRPSANLIFSVDDGRTWGSEIPLVRGGAKTTGYTSMAQVGGNEIVVVFDIMKVPLRRIWLWEPNYVGGIFQRRVKVTRRW